MLSRLSAHPRLALIPFGVLVLVALLAPLPGSAAPETRTLHVDAAQFAFTPGRVQVNQGDRITITLSASDVVHGFYLDGYGLEQRIVPGVAQEVTFIADRPGKFRYRCAVSCGPLHPFMVGELIVAANTPYWRAIAVVLSASAGMLVYMWFSGQNKSVQEVSRGTS
ncbi:cupredoxin domain-containing protein [Aggregatilinea lenta]|uniref:cupredoxin domain-containing protein n=1 Tax=Aggregatilinea lenta TaxID=913108 RepID=UPI000E5A2C64|nr:cupredoxin domain-containing protein [Aggregatilinea lenta]